MIWKLLHGTAVLLLWIIFAWMVLGRTGKRGSARVLSDDRVEFAQDRIAFWGWLLMFMYTAWVAAKTLMKDPVNPWNFITAACLGFMALSFLFSIPGAVVTTDDGLEQIYWFWRNKRIRWKDIVEINAGEKSQTVEVTSADGTKIVHSRFLADRKRFLLELKEHCGEELPPDFPREPIKGD